MPSINTKPGTSLLQEVATARLLLKLLEQEQAHLIEADVKALESLTPQKHTLVSRMSSFAITRQKALAEAGYPSEEASMQKWLSSSANLAKEQQTWNELVQLVQSAKELNRTNGILIGTHMARNQNALQILQQEQPGNTYGPDGKKQLKSSGRSIIAG